MVTIAFGFIVEHAAVEWRGAHRRAERHHGHSVASVFGTGVRRARRGARCPSWSLRCSRLADSLAAMQSGARRCARCAMPRSPPNRSASTRCASRPLAFAISAACAGLAGALFAPLSGFVTPSTFAFSQSILFVLVVIDRRRGHRRRPAGRRGDRRAAARSARRARRIPVALFRRAAAGGPVDRARRHRRRRSRAGCGGAARAALATRRRAQVAAAHDRAPPCASTTSRSRSAA